MKYRTIVADPPWGGSVYTRPGWSWREGKPSGTERPLDYPTMTLDEIRALPIYKLSDNVDHDAHLYLWTTSHHLPEAFGIVSAWGFRYTATLVWCKPSRGWSVGGQFQNNVEFVLFCTRQKRTSRPDVLRLTSALADAAKAAGISRADVDAHMGTIDMGSWWLSRIETRCACPTNEQWIRLRELLGLDDRLDELVAEINSRKGSIHHHTKQASDSRWFTWPRSSHSVKPEAFMDMVEQVSPGPYLELFARRNRIGWDTWGNEALEHVEVVA